MHHLPLPLYSPTAKLHSSPTSASAPNSAWAEVLSTGNSTNPNAHNQKSDVAKTINLLCFDTPSSLPGWEAFEKHWTLWAESVYSLVKSIRTQEILIARISMRFLMVISQK